MKAELTDQWKLLDLAQLDTRLTQLAHRRRTLPQLAELDELRRQEQLLHEEVVLAEVAVDDTRREIDRAESDVQVVRDRAARDRQRLDSGQGSAKELTSLQHELETLARRQGELEDIQLEVMERREALRAEHDAKVERRDQVRGRIAELERTRDVDLAEVDRAEAEVGTDRQVAARGVPVDLLGLYDKLRAQYGVGAAALVERRCGGCGLELNAGELARIKAAPTDEVLRCEECRRILIRTAESGL